MKLLRIINTLPIYVVGNQFIVILYYTSLFIHDTNDYNIIMGICDIRESTNAILCI